MSQFLKSLISKLDQNGLPALLAGGWAVNHFGFSRATNDLDFLFSRTDRDRVIATLKSMEFTMFSDSNQASRFQRKELHLPIVDAMWLDQSTYSKMVERAENSSNLPGLQFINLEHLIAMKLHALSAHETRHGRDLNDIKELIRINPEQLDAKTLRELCKKHAPDWAMAELNL